MQLSQLAQSQYVRQQATSSFEAHGAFSIGTDISSITYVDTRVFCAEQEASRWSVNVVGGAFVSVIAVSTELYTSVSRHFYVKHLFPFRNTSPKLQSSSSAEILLA